jgi:hypothetical protein
MVSSERKWEKLYEAITDKMGGKKYIKNGIDLFKGQFKIDGGNNLSGMKRRPERREIAPKMKVQGNKTSREMAS